MKKLFCCPALELFHCLPLWKTVLFVSSRAFLLSTPTFLLSTPVENNEATWKKATKCNKFVSSILGKSMARPNCFRFYLTFNCISFSIIVPAYIADSEELPTPMAQRGDSNFFYGAGIQLFVAAAGFIITVLATVYCFCLRKEARLTLEQRDQIQKEKWEKRTNAQRY